MSTDADIIIALARKLEAQNPSTLEAENAPLRRERDQLKADAMSDLIKRHWLENQVRNREAERDFLRAENSELREARDRADRLFEAFRHERDFLTDSTTPRIITADGLREGQLICIHRGHGWGVRAIGTFVNLEGDLVTIKTGGSGTFSESTKFHTIVLLEDAPEPDDDFPCCSDTPPRLTVHALNTAPVGSILRKKDGHQFAKGYANTWFSVTTFGQLTRTGEELLSAGYADATLTHPKRGDHE